MNSDQVAVGADPRDVGLACPQVVHQLVKRPDR